MSKVVYYRDSDGVVIGSTNSPGKVDIAYELKSWGNGISALEVLDDMPQSGKIRKVVSGQLVHETDPVHDDFVLRKRDLYDKLKTRLSLTDREMQLFIGNRL